ncbi:hypothetical protein [Cyclobacterium amurskyense]|jgi:hypothetical protein|nr:hypothetical protein [Cyclobacterium amurskyense]|tara:strand:- start:5534 stop:5911 length:378 start_codon:yes stop_codon:yes gene_type:complete
MKLNRKNKGLMRQRLTLLIVMLFCVFVSSSELMLSIDSKENSLAVQLDLSSDNEDGQSDDTRTFIHTSIDAVVPFVMYALDYAYHFIYEIVIADRPQTNFNLGTDLEYNQLFKILFEQIISVNAP